MSTDETVATSSKSAVAQLLGPISEIDVPEDLLHVIDSLLAFHPASSQENIIRGYQFAKYLHR